MTFVHEWIYHADGKQVGKVIRYEENGQKKVIPYFNLNGGKGIPEGMVLPLYGEVNEATKFVVEGEKCVDALLQLGVGAVTSQGGANKAHKSNWEPLKDVPAVFLSPDNDAAGERYMQDVADILFDQKHDRNVRIIHLGGLPRKGDIVDWIKARIPDWDGYKRDNRIIDLKTEFLTLLDTAGCVGQPISIHDFRAYMPDHRYIFKPTRELWPVSSVDARFDWPEGPDGKPMKPSRWLDANAPVEQMTWMPGAPMVIENKLVDTGGWIDRQGCTCFNLYRPPTLLHGDSEKAGPWLDHVQFVYPDDAGHIIQWLAHRVKKPGEKLNHALVLGGRHGIGKDTILEPAKQAVGPWNCHEVNPAAMLGRFNGFVKSVILRVSEARDLGDVDRFKFYDHTKSLIAAPPDVIRVDEKNIREYAVPNVCGVIITTNHKADGLYLPADDRRHYIAWSELDREQFDEGYWNELWQWYGNGGTGHVAAYLAQFDLSDFDAKAPPPKTEAFWHIVNAARPPEESELADIFDDLNWPDAITLDTIVARAGVVHRDTDFSFWLKDRKHRRQIPHRLEAVGYESVRNPSAKDGLWAINGRRQAVYTRATLPLRDRHSAAARLSR
jgi:hypothetical protein